MCIAAFINGEIVLKRNNIDVNPQYAESLDFDLFVVHLIFGTGENPYESKKYSGDLRHTAPYHKPGRASFEAGLDEVR